MSDPSLQGGDGQSPPPGDGPPPGDSPPPGSGAPPGYGPPYAGSPYGAPPYSQPPYSQPYGAAVGQSNGLGIAALVCGILSIILCWTVVGGVILGILGIVFGVVGRRRANRGDASNGGMAIGGAICGAAGLVLVALLIVLGVSIFHRISNDVHNYHQCIQNAQTHAQRHACNRSLHG